VVANCDHLNKLKYVKALPYAFSEHGAIMAASVLNSDRAIAVSVFVVRAFVELRRTIAENKELSKKIDQVERRIAKHDDQILALVQAIKQLLTPAPLSKKRPIGFRTNGH
jgi:hypothetical protein